MVQTAGEDEQEAAAEAAEAFLAEELPETIFGAPKAGNGMWASCLRIMHPTEVSKVCWLPGVPCIVSCDLPAALCDLPAALCDLPAASCDLPAALWDLPAELHHVTFSYRVALWILFSLSRMKLPSGKEMAVQGVCTCPYMCHLSALPPVSQSALLPLAVMQSGMWW